jgi:hypothetical protein
MADYQDPSAPARSPAAPDEQPAERGRRDWLWWVEVVAVVVTVVLVCAEVVAIGVNAWVIRNHDLGPRPWSPTETWLNDHLLVVTAFLVPICLVAAVVLLAALHRRWRRWTVMTPWLLLFLLWFPLAASTLVTWFGD